MVRRLDAHDPGLEMPVVLVQIAEEFELRRGWPDDEERISPLERARHLLEETARILGMRGRLTPSQRVPVEMMLRRQDGRLVGGVRVEMEDTRFLVIDPGDRVGGHALMFGQRRAHRLCN